MSEHIHWIGERRNTLHGNGAGSKDMEHVSGDEDEVDCPLCLNLLAREDIRERIAVPVSSDQTHPPSPSCSTRSCSQKPGAAALDAER